MVAQARAYGVEGGRRVVVWDVVWRVYLMCWAGLLDLSVGWPVCVVCRLRQIHLVAVME